jgi:chromosomal replication initiation ATPase DnaA
MSEGNIWTAILDRLRLEIDEDEFRRWFSTSSYASDSGDQITVWVPTAVEGRQIDQYYLDRLHRILAAFGRTNTTVRFVATGYVDEEDDEQHE